MEEWGASNTVKNAWSQTCTNANVSTEFSPRLRNFALAYLNLFCRLNTDSEKVVARVFHKIDFLIKSNKI